MDAQHLRKGNRILVSLPNEKVRIPNIEAEVQGVTLFYEIICFHTPQKQGFKIHQKHCSPIKLTDDWMIKAGFEYSKESDKWFNDTILYSKTYRMYKHSNGRFLVTYKDCIIVTLEYVHEFQNFYQATMKQELKFN